jgi:hypothetical protein
MEHCLFSYRREKNEGRMRIRFPSAPKAMSRLMDVGLYYLFSGGYPLENRINLIAFEGVPKFVSRG